MVKFEVRWFLACMFFLIGFIAYMDRANISVAASFVMKDFGITKTQFGFLGSLFAISYGAAQIPGSFFINRYGNKMVIVVALITWSIFTILTPLAGTFFMLCVVRFLFGIGESPIYTSSANFNNYWFSKEEKGRAASFILAGSYFGPVIAPFFAVWIIQNWGWHMVFYVFGVIGVLIAILYYFVSSSKPELHKFISKRELNFILENRSPPSRHKKPWAAFMKNKEFHALGISYFFCAYTIGMFMIWLPTFLLEHKGMNLKSMGIYAAAPWLAIFSFVLFGGALSDKILRATKSLLKARTYLAAGGFLAFDFFIIFVVFSKSLFISIFCLSVAFGCIGLPVVISWAVAADKGRNYAASVSAYMNTCAHVGSAISPVLVGYLVDNFGWNVAILSNIVPVSMGAISYFFVRPDNALLPSD